MYVVQKKKRSYKHFHLNTLLHVQSTKRKRLISSIQRYIFCRNDCLIEAPRKKKKKKTLGYIFLPLQQQRKEKKKKERKKRNKNPEISLVPLLFSRPTSPLVLHSFFSSFNLGITPTFSGAQTLLFCRSSSAKAMPYTKKTILGILFLIVFQIFYRYKNNNNSELPKGLLVISMSPRWSSFYYYLRSTVLSY